MYDIVDVHVQVCILYTSFPKSVGVSTIFVGVANNVHNESLHVHVPSAQGFITISEHT